MISKNKIKLIRQLSGKKFRYENSLFVAEGHKCVNELLSSFECVWMACIESYSLPVTANKPTEIQIVTACELRQISLLETPQDVLAIFKMKRFDVGDVMVEGALTLAIDGVQDAGNMGTIVRIADWFGVENIVCSHGTVDIYNPKCVQATMGALSRVNVIYTDLPEFLKCAAKKVTVFSTTLDGDDIYKANLPSSAVLVMGNEGNGVSDAVSEVCDRALFIPSFPSGRPTSESLNVGVATAIACAEIRRRTICEG